MVGNFGAGTGRLIFFIVRVIEIGVVVVEGDGPTEIRVVVFTPRSLTMAGRRLGRVDVVKDPQATGIDVKSVVVGVAVGVVV